jgi:hypothetical protein
MNRGGENRPVPACRVYVSVPLPRNGVCVRCAALAPVQTSTMCCCCDEIDGGAGKDPVGIAVHAGEPATCCSPSGRTDDCGWMCMNAARCARESVVVRSVGISSMQSFLSGLDMMRLGCSLHLVRVHMQRVGCVFLIAFFPLLFLSGAFRSLSAFIITCTSISTRLSFWKRSAAAAPLFWYRKAFAHDGRPCAVCPRCLCDR